MTEPDTSPEKRPVQFTWDDVTYTVDLDPTEAAEFHARLAPFIAVARRTDRRASSMTRQAVDDRWPRA